MSSRDSPSVLDCETPRRKRSYSGPRSTIGLSNKQRRISLASIDISREIDGPVESYGQLTASDRFISSRPDTLFPLNVTPRTNRIARKFGLADERILQFTDSSRAVATESPETHLFRRSAATLLLKPSVIPSTSVMANLGARQHFILALDGPGISMDPYAYPLAWSTQNFIAVACSLDVYHQNLDTKSISHLCKLKLRQGKVHTIDWAGSDSPNTLGLGTLQGTVQIWDATGKGTKTRSWTDPLWIGVGGMSWNKDLLAVGKGDGKVLVYDTRAPGDTIKKVGGHKGKVHGVKWSTDGKYLATGDDNGTVFVWDWRMGKNLAEGDKRSGKMKHSAPVKALGWCPWRPELLATGSMIPDGSIRIWNANTLHVSTLTSPSPSPKHTISLRTSVTSLHWSPHCKELLSTHSASCDPAPPLLGSRNTNNSPRFSNSITVHSYPSYDHLVSVPAHLAGIGHSCLGPDGTQLFTLCQNEENMKLWQVWGAPEKVYREVGVLDKCSIR
ncbi:hypothetical protein JAAARDRAFT_36753 [Jaapia argillacea MUCL 33604]|uniref:CDC20/Fizzy WD40 domain-containing protein n=1 Tax=Jaapia argillacea MUCL 33604 TaxID=933084 RepID=A0A067Q051_9AGAM|nr:hypothetical protein JAAARDRAFT_36753 [Jaapia argillacea MUCL 33604]